MKPKHLQFRAEWNSRHVHADVHAGESLKPLAGGSGSGRFFGGDVGGNRFDRLALRGHADVRVVLQHLPRHMPSKGLDGGVAGVALGKLRNRAGCATQKWTIREFPFLVA